MYIRCAGAIALAFLLPAGAYACSSCGCTLNSDWSSQGYTTHAGWSLDARVDLFDQKELRAGRRSVDRASLEVPNEMEIQRYTRNRNTTLALDYSGSRDWGVTVSVPYYDRPHATIAEGDVDTSWSHGRGIGDVRIVGRYQGFAPDLGIGLQFGVKLANGRTDERFTRGPQAGEPLDRGLQLGTGTTDLLLGVYAAGALGSKLSYFGSVLLQQPTNSRDGFRPGRGVNATLAVRWSGALPGGIVPQLQLNARVEDRECGANADAGNSGASLVYLSPGVGFRIAERVDGFAFVQVPVYQRVNGLQLQPKVFGSAGFRYRF